MYNMCIVVNMLSCVCFFLLIVRKSSEYSGNLDEQGSNHDPSKMEWRIWTGAWSISHLLIVSKYISLRHLWCYKSL